MFLVGTSGFAYSDWVGPFYAEGIRPGAMLREYASHFSTVELDLGYGRIPSARAVRGLLPKVPDGFLFCMRAPRSVTDGGDASAEGFIAFRGCLEPLADEGRLGCVLACFPFGFRLTEANLRYLLRLSEEFAGYELVVEFRNSEWVVPQTFDFLRRCRIGYVGIDEPRLKGLMPPVVEVTSQTACVRFNGRNRAKWWNYDAAWERYDYLYSMDELGEWSPALESVGMQAARTFVLFNNCHMAQAAQSAFMMQSILDAMGECQ